MILDDFITERPEWHGYAACADPSVNPEIMYPDTTTDPIIARVICQECPVRFECLLEGLHEEWGIWGGYTASERNRLRRYLPTEPVARRLALYRAAYLGPANYGVADHTHPMKGTTNATSPRDDRR